MRRVRCEAIEAVKFYTPQSLAKEIGCTARFIRDHHQQFGFAKIGARYIASHENIIKALGECSTNGQTQNTGTSNLSTAEVFSGSPLAAHVRKMRSESRSNGDDISRHNENEAPTPSETQPFDG